MKIRKKTSGGFGRLLLRVLGDSRRQSVTIPVLAVVVSLLVAAVIMLCIGKNPLVAFRSLLQGSGFWAKPAYAARKGVLTDLLSFIDSMTPMLFAALGVAAAYKAGLFNIGISGQMLLSGFVATIVVGYSGLEGWLAKPLVILIGILVGAAVGGLIGYLKYKFNINEVVSSIMLNYIIRYVTTFFINVYYVDPVSRQSRYISAASRLTLKNVDIGGLRMDIPLGIILGIVVAFLLHFLLERTKVGYEIKAVGANRNAARYAGMSVGKNIVLSMLLSGALAGLAGVTYYLGYFSSIQPRTLVSVGFDAIAVALLANCHPVGIIFSSGLISIVTKGSAYMSSTVGVEQEMASLITGLILLFSACGTYARQLLRRLQDAVDEEARNQKEGGDA